MFGAMHEEYYQMFYLLSDHRGIENGIIILQAVFYTQET